MVIGLFVVLVVALAVAIVAGELLQSRGHISEAHGGFRLDLLAGSALTLAVIMCSFMLAVTYTGYNGANSDAGVEAAAVSAEYQAATVLPDRAAARTTAGDLLCYARAVRSDEWSSFGTTAVPSERVEHWRVALQDDLVRAGTADDSRAVQDLRTADQTRTSTHQIRLTTAVGHTPLYLFVLLIAVCAAAIFFVTAFTVQTIGRRLRLPVVAVLTVLLAGTLGVIVDLNHPYTGLSRVGPEAMTRAVSINLENYRDVFAGAPLTACDDVGRPTG